MTGTQTIEAKTDVIFNAIRKTTDTLAETIKEYNQKYTAKYIKTSKEFIEKTEKDSRKIMDNFVSTGKDKVKEYNEKYLSKITENSKEFYSDILSKGKELKAKLPIDKIEDQISKSYNAVTEHINLPRREDIENLTKSMDTLNANVDVLNKKLT